MLQYNTIEVCIKAVSKELYKKGIRKIFLLKGAWEKQFDKLSSFYCIFEKAELKYVGEMGSLNSRMADLLNTKNHTHRSSLGEGMFSKEKGYQKAGTKQSYISSIEKKLEKYIQDHISVNSLPLEIGRREFEE